MCVPIRIAARFFLMEPYFAFIVSFIGLDIGGICPGCFVQLATHAISPDEKEWIDKFPVSHHSEVWLPVTLTGHKRLLGFWESPW